MVSDGRREFDFSTEMGIPIHLEISPGGHVGEGWIEDPEHTFTIEDDLIAGGETMLWPDDFLPIAKRWKEATGRELKAPPHLAAMLEHLHGLEGT